MRDLIINGTFDSGSANWGGTDLETSYTENAYLGNGSSNRVAEMDGQSGQTTVMEQSFTVNNPDHADAGRGTAHRLSESGWNRRIHS
ncbi:hypothetical protein [Phaeobacter inhibens]|uniref:hypothetical protein n=1 Tax=Phaeobacter inhibens TaxID=221822 RepID=UPI000A653BEA|nr:hypothetical protein [Phaeobacter inhibens]WHP69702.1 hypothetical protein QMZ01_05835 [Phaeobacter inhibens]